MKKDVFQPGTTRSFSRKVRPEDCAVFDTGPVHPLYATFAVARDAEWCCRLFVLEMKEEDEEGIGTFIEVKHRAPAPPGSVVDFTATIESIGTNKITCTYEAWLGDTLIASGRQSQQVLKSAKLEKLYRGRR